MKQLRAKLVNELAALRKGEGMTPAKLGEKIVVRTTVARITNASPDGITTSQIYNFLLLELSNLPESDQLRALRNAYGIGTTENQLVIRRARLAAQLHKHTDTIERYENRAIQELALHLLNRGALKVQDIEATPSRPSLYLQQLTSQAKAARTVASVSLAAHLSLGTHGEDFVRYLEQSRRPYLEASVHLKLIPSARGKEWYCFKLSCTFQGARETFRVAVVLDSSDGEQLMASGLIDDFHQLNDFSNFSREIKAIMASSRLRLRNPAANTQKLVRLHELEGDQAARLIQSAGKTLAKPCWILEGTIPEEWQGEGIIHEHQSIINLRCDENYAYWYSPALMYLKRLTCDFSEFPDADMRRFFLQPFLGHTPGKVVEEKHLYTLVLNDWIMPGHGIVLVWRDV